MEGLVLNDHTQILGRSLPNLLRAAGRDQKGSRRQEEESVRSPSTSAGGRYSRGTRPLQGTYLGCGDHGAGASPAKPGNSPSLEATPNCLPGSLPRVRACTHRHTRSSTNTGVYTYTPTGKCHVESGNLSLPPRSRTEPRPRVEAGFPRGGGSQATPSPRAQGPRLPL